MQVFVVCIVMVTLLKIVVVWFGGELCTSTR